LPTNSDDWPIFNEFSKKSRKIREKRVQTLLEVKTINTLEQITKTFENQIRSFNQNNLEWLLKKETYFPIKMVFYAKETQLK